MNGVKLIQGVDLLDLVRVVDKRNKVHQRVMLNSIENLELDPKTYQVIRKIVLDNTNDFARTVLRELFGDSFEGEIK